MPASLRFLVTGGAGFIGSAVTRRLIAETGHSVCVVDKLTYAGNLASLAPVAADPRFRFEKADIADGERMRAIFAEVDPDIVLHLAAESHVDRSIAREAQGTPLHAPVCVDPILTAGPDEAWFGIGCGGGMRGGGKPRLAAAAKTRRHGECAGQADTKRSTARG